MTNHWIDIKNADVIMIIGSNAAENHPISIKWVEESRRNGGVLISVDPRFTRTSALADIYAPLRSGTDIAFIGGLINYVLENNLYHEEYVAEYTNASFLVNPNFGFNDGLFVGYNPDKRSYDKATWAYQTDADGIPLEDKTLQEPHTAFQHLKRHYARYDLDTVSTITGTPKSVLEQVYSTYAATGQAGKAGTIMYAMGATQHTYGTQNVRSYALLQLLLGNIGVAGGGINALRGLHNVQGSTDMCLLFHILPGYLSTPVEADQTLADYLARVTPKSNDPNSVNWWKNYPKYIVSLLKAWWGEAATADNEFAFHYLPRNSGNYSWIPLFEAMYRGDIKGLLALGQNPAVGGPNANMERKAMENLDWLVVIDLWETETAGFWKRPGANSADIKTEVFLLPAASYVEREGSVTNSGRWVQWRHKAIDPIGNAKEDLWIINEIMHRVRDLYTTQGGTFPEPVVNLTWDYGDGLPDVEQVAREISGTALVDLKDGDGNVIVPAGKQVKNFTQLRDDGSTAAGNWLYGYYTEEGNLAQRRDPVDQSGIGLYSNWAWDWPVNRRIIYNRASVHPVTGEPWDTEHPVIRWDAAAEKWVGDVPDGGTPPNTIHPFIMKPEGHGRIFGFGLADGPFPEHYEPWESVVQNILSPTQNNPIFKIWASEMDYKGEGDKYPVVATTYRVTEHMQAGAMTRNLPWLVEAMPELFVEMSQELASEKGIKNGDQVAVESARGTVAGVAVVTSRFRPFRVNGQVIHQVGVPWHWGYSGISTGDSANVLTPHVGDANTMIPEFKAFLCDVRKAV
jgi:formate dehydrogenase-N alpha subunit